MISPNIRPRKRYILLKVHEPEESLSKEKIDQELKRIFGIFFNLKLGLYTVSIDNDYIILRVDANSLNIVLAGLFLIKNIGIIKIVKISGSIKQLRKQIR